jgi:hypothetical protein
MQRRCTMANSSGLVERALRHVYRNAQRQNSAILGTPHLFIALAELHGDTAAALPTQGCDSKKVGDALRANLGRVRPPRESSPG